MARKVKLCCDCRWYTPTKANGNPTFASCGHPRAAIDGIDYVAGRSPTYFQYCSVFRRDIDLFYWRRCGSRGRFWERAIVVASPEALKAGVYQPGRE